MGLLARLAPLLDAMGLDLVMPGSADQATLLKYVPEMPRNVILPGRIADHDLKKALEGALCFLLPSRIEGFGLPVVEAMASGCPVVASTSPCLPEIGGDAALFADPNDVAAWAECVGMVLRSAELRSQLVAKGYARASGYSWRTIAEKYLRLMREVDEEFETSGSAR